MVSLVILALFTAGRKGEERGGERGGREGGRGRREG